jgi:hypothetical protein
MRIFESDKVSAVVRALAFTAPTVMELDGWVTELPALALSKTAVSCASG